MELGLAHREHVALRGRLVLVAVAVGVAASLVDGPILCPWRRCTGGYCPACGMTRSTGRLLRGDVAGSWREHPFVVLALAQGVVAAVALWRWSGGRRAPFGQGATRGLTAGLLRPILAVEGLLVLAIWVVRMIDGSVPVPFVAG